MKALAFLEDLKVKVRLDKEIVSDHIKYELDEAITELEALENKSCDGCKHYLSDNGNFPLEPCGECSRFYADKFERKEDEN